MACAPRAAASATPAMAALTAASATHPLWALAPMCVALPLTGTEWRPQPTSYSFGGDIGNQGYEGKYVTRLRLHLTVFLFLFFFCCCCCCCCCCSLLTLACAG